MCRPTSHFLLSFCKPCAYFACHLQFFLEYGLLEMVLLPSLCWKTKFLEDQQILGQKLTEAFGDIVPEAQQCHCFLVTIECKIQAFTNATPKQLVKRLKCHFFDLIRMRYFCTSQSRWSTPPINLLYFAIKCGWELGIFCFKDADHLLAVAIGSTLW